MNCGDVVYRSTLDPKLRLEEARRRAIPWLHASAHASSPAQPPLITQGGFALLLLVLGYLSATPGAGAGFLDYYVLAPLAKVRQPKYSLDDFEFQQKLGEGGFGDVWRALNKRTGKAAVIKCARAYGDVEAWMNERATRACPGKTAAFLGSFSDARQPVLPSGGAAAEGKRLPFGAFALPDMPDWSELAAGRLPWGQRCVWVIVHARASRAWLSEHARPLPQTRRS